MLQQRTDQAYGWDEEGGIYHFTPNSSGAWKRLAEGGAGSRFVYYRPKSGGGDTAQTFFGTGRIASVEAEEQEGDEHFLAKIEGYHPFARPVPARSSILGRMCKCRSRRPVGLSSRNS